MLPMDANVRLCRRKNAAKVNTAPPLLQDHFSPQQEVDDYVESRSGSTLLYIQIKHWIGSKATSKSKVLYTCTFTRTNVVILGLGMCYVLCHTTIFWMKRQGWSCLQA